MRATVVAGLTSAILGFVTPGRSAENPPSRGGATATVPVNSQESLAATLGDDVREMAWTKPAGLLPREFPKLTHVSGPNDRGLSPKAAWRKPLVLKDEATGIAISVNCYRRREKKRAAAAVPGTPAAPLLEPDYRYEPLEFHGLKAAAASNEDRHVFAFRDGDVLFKVEATGGEADQRRKTATGVAEAIWKLRQPK